MFSSQRSPDSFQRRRSFVGERLLRAFATMQPLNLGGFDLRYPPGDNTGTNYVELTYWTGSGYIR